MGTPLDRQGRAEGPTPAIDDRAASPEARGGTGVAFEARVGAMALSRLLRGDRVPGLDRPPKRIRLQQLMAGAVLDDVVFDADDRRGGDQTIEYQRPTRRPAPPMIDDSVGWPCLRIDNTNIFGLACPSSFWTTCWGVMGITSSGNDDRCARGVEDPFSGAGPRAPRRRTGRASAGSVRRVQAAETV